jgi:uncharacterized protein YabE (DUF348 family)
MKALHWLRTNIDMTLRLSALLLAIAGAGVLYLATASRLLVEIEGEARTIRTHARTVSGALASAGVTLGEGDRVQPPLDEAISSGEIIVVQPAADVRIDVDGERVEVSSASDSAANILSDAGFRLYPGDRVWVDQQIVPDPAEPLNAYPKEIRVRRGQRVTLLSAGETSVFYSAAETLAGALAENGVFVRQGDVLTPPAHTPLDGPIDASLERGQPIQISTVDRQWDAYAVGPTVGEALAQAGFPLQGLDYSQPAAYEPLPASGEIRVVRMREELLVELAPLPFSLTYEPAADLEIDQLTILDPGKYGVLANRVRVVYQDGEEIERSVEEAIEVVAPQPRVVGYGTKIVVRTLSTAGGVIEYWRAVPMYATAYAPCFSAADRCYPHTSSGMLVQKGVVAFILEWYLQMKGWPVYIPDYGYATVEDVGGGIPGRKWIDLGYSDDDIISWNKWVTVYFLTPVPPLGSIPWILE